MRYKSQSQKQQEQIQKCLSKAKPGDRIKYYYNGMVERPLSESLIEGQSDIAGGVEVIRMGSTNVINTTDDLIVSIIKNK